MAFNVLNVDPDKMLFAQDMVNFIFRRHTDRLQYIPEGERANIHEGFSESVRDATGLIDEMLKPEIETTYNKILESDNGYSFTLNEYAFELRQVCFSEGFDAKNFLHYCVHMTVLVEKFHPDAIDGAKDLAYGCIVESFRDYNMSSGGWDNLQVVAIEYQNQCLNRPTPSPASSDILDGFPIPEEDTLGWINGPIMSTGEVSEETDNEAEFSSEYMSEEEENEDVPN